MIPSSDEATQRVERLRESLRTYEQDDPNDWPVIDPDDLRFVLDLLASPKQESATTRERDAGTVDDAYTTALAASRIAGLTDEQLHRAFDSALSDFGLAESYDHNAHLRPRIRQRLDLLQSEICSRWQKSFASRPSPMSEATPGEPTTDEIERAYTAGFLDSEQYGKSIGAEHVGYERLRAIAEGKANYYAKLRRPSSGQAT